MAQDIEKLIVSLSADFKSYENAMRRASGMTRDQLRQLKTEAGQVGTVADQSFKRFAAAAKGSQGNVVQFRTGVQQASFQIQDFIVQVAGGTSAMKAFGQQAPQILGVFGSVGAAVGLLAAGVPLLAAGFSSLGAEGVDLDDTMKALKESLAAVADATSVADTAMAGFGASLADIAEGKVKAAIAALREQLLSLTSDKTIQIDSEAGLFGVPEATIAGWARLRDALQLTDEQAVRLNDALQAVADAPMEKISARAQEALGVIASITTETGRTTEAMDAVANAVRLAAENANALSSNTSSATTAAQGLANSWMQVAASAQEAMMASGRAIAAQARAQAQQQAINNSRPTSFGGAGNASPSDFPLSGVPGDFVNSQFPLDFKMITPAPAASSAGRSGGRSGGGTSRGVDEALRDAGRVQSEITRMIGQVRDEDLESLKQANHQVAESFSDVFTSAITGAQSLQDSIADLASQLGRLMLTRGFEALLGQVGFTLPGLPALAGARANGGPVSAGRPYLVGEHGPEIFIPDAVGKIAANRSLRGGGSTVNLTYAPTIDARGADAAAVARIEAAQRTQAASFRDQVAKAIRDPRKR